MPYSVRPDVEKDESGRLSPCSIEGVNAKVLLWQHEDQLERCIAESR